MAAVFTEANDRLGAIRGFGFACFVYGLRCECAALFFQPAAVVCAGTKRMKSGCKRSILLCLRSLWPERQTAAAATQRRACLCIRGQGNNSPILGCFRPTY